MGCPAPPARPQLSGSCPLPSRFQTFRSGAPPPPGAAVAIPPSPVPRSVLPRNGGEGTPGLSIGTLGPPTPSLGPVAAPGRADVGAPREARALRPRNQPRPGACPSPAEPGGAGAAGGRTRDRAAGSPEPKPEPEPEPGGRNGGTAQGGAGGAGGGCPVLTSAGTVHPGAAALRAGGSWRAGGWGAGLTSPQSPEAAERLRDGKRKGGGREGEGPGSPAGRVG